MGFLEGDGSFFIRSNNTLGFEISQKTIDPILYYIKKELGVGRVVHNSVSGVSRLVLPSSAQGCYHIINTIKLEDFRLNKRQDQYSKWIAKVFEFFFFPVGEKRKKEKEVPYIFSQYEKTQKTFASKSPCLTDS